MPEIVRGPDDNPKVGFVWFRRESASQSLATVTTKKTVPLQDRVRASLGVSDVRGSRFQEGLAVVAFCVFLFVADRVFEWSYGPIVQILRDWLEFVAWVPAGLVGVVGGVILIPIILLLIACAFFAALVFAFATLHWTVFVWLAGFALLAAGAARLNDRLKRGSRSDFKGLFSTNLMTKIRDTALTLGVGVLLVPAIQAVVILFSEFKGDSALIWTNLAPLLRLKAIPLLWLAGILVVLILLSALWPQIPFLSRGKKALKWYRRTKTALFVACSFTLAGAVAGAGIAKQYAVRLGPEKIQPVPEASIAARQAAAAYLEWCLRVLTPADRRHLVMVMLDIESHPAREIRMRSVADQFAFSVAVDLPDEEVRQSSPEKPAPPEPNDALYKEARDQSISILADAVKEATKHAGATVSEPFVAMFVDTLIGTLAKTSFEGVVPKTFPNLRALEEWAGGLRRAPPHVGDVDPTIDLGYFGPGVIEMPKITLPSTILEWSGRSGEETPKGIEPRAPKPRRSRPKLPELP